MWNNGLKKMIQLYGVDMEDELDVSSFEYLDTFGMRSDLHRNRDKLEQTDLQLLHKYDQMLLNRSKELYNYMKPVYSFNDPSKPIEEWWWHLDRVITGELHVEMSME
ncbi:hypothetical protein [Paenibacillus tundrae]|uniref:CdiI immunity protein domain-containing protein n=1 Tax=Paenibacillus tundrae TaxID=528187 RepID=A0ABT9WGR0_9BACL|nr:hypothetical protein [Paenibacillus tundrae]MDQ0172424.1 hypothetical protein [Paenibacillus tundrae]